MHITEHLLGFLPFFFFLGVKTTGFRGLAEICYALVKNLFFFSKDVNTPGSLSSNIACP